MRIPSKYERDLFDRRWEYYEKYGYISETQLREENFYNRLENIAKELAHCARNSSVGKNRLQWFMSLGDSDFIKNAGVPDSLFTCACEVIELVQGNFDEMRNNPQLYWRNSHTLTKAGMRKTRKVLNVIYEKLWCLPPVGEQIPSERV